MYREHWSRQGARPQESTLPAIAEFDEGPPLSAEALAARLAFRARVAQLDAQVAARRRFRR
jgi:hypothetical protein